MPFNEPLKKWRYVKTVHGAALGDLVSDFLGYIPRPALSRVERNDPHWIGVLSIHQVGDDCLPVSKFFTGFAPCAAEATEIIEDQINVLVGWKRGGN